MNRAERPNPEARQRRRWQVLILLCIVIGSTLAMTSVALAQQSSSFDLGCWSVTTGGGGRHSSFNTALQDALVGGAAGNMTSASYRLRAGYAQSWTFLTPNAAIADGGTANAITAATPQADNDIYLPIISNFVRIQRTCPG